MSMRSASSGTEPGEQGRQPVIIIFQQTGQLAPHTYQIGWTITSRHRDRSYRCRKQLIGWQPRCQQEGAQKIQVFTKCNQFFVATGIDRIMYRRWLWRQPLHQATIVPITNRQRSKFRLKHLTKIGMRTINLVIVEQPPSVRSTTHHCPSTWFTAAGVDIVHQTVDY
jgi:hypothetical protein